MASFRLQCQRAGLAQVPGNDMEPIVFELRDIDADVVRAWEKYFNGTIGRMPPDLSARQMARL